MNLTNLTDATAKGLILNLTLTCETLAASIVAARTPKATEVAVARFQRVNDERLALIENHGLQGWATGL